MTSHDHTHGSCHSVITSVSQLLRLQPTFNQPSTITSMSIDSNMILENDRFEEEMTRANLIFLVEQEAETLQCQQLRERAAAQSSTTRGALANVSMWQSARTLIHGSCCVVFDLRSGSTFGFYNQNTLFITGKATDPICNLISCQYYFWIIDFCSCTNHENSSKGSSSTLAGSPNIHWSHDHASSLITMMSKDELPLFKCLPWLTNAIVGPFDKMAEYTNVLFLWVLTLVW